MIQQIELEEAEKNFRDLIQKSIYGKEFIIMKNDQPLVKIVPFKKVFIRKLGTAKGKVFIKKGFKEIPEDFKEYIP